MNESALEPEPRMCRSAVKSSTTSLCAHRRITQKGKAVFFLHVTHETTRILKTPHFSHRDGSNRKCDTASVRGLQRQSYVTNKWQRCHGEICNIVVAMFMVEKIYEDTVQGPQLYSFQGNANIKGAVSRYSVIFCAFFARAKMAVPRARVADIRPESLAVRAAWQPGHGHLRWLVTWQIRAVNQRQVEPELHCFTCRRRQAALLFSGYEARARWYPLLQGSRLAATAVSISILYFRVWFCAPSEACFGDLVAETHWLGDWEKESPVRS